MAMTKRYQVWSIERGKGMMFEGVGHHHDTFTTPGKARIHVMLIEKNYPLREVYVLEVYELSKDAHLGAARG